MAGVALVTGKRYAQGSERSFFAIGTVQDDGYIYFNDDLSYRCTVKKEYMQVYNVKRRRWVGTNNIYEVNTLNFDVSGIIGGNGSIAPNADVETAVKWAIATANDPAHGYDWGSREGPDYDCASLLCHAFRNAGFPIPMPSYNVDGMVANFPSLGWEFIQGIGNDASKLTRGDILVKLETHVAMYIGNNQCVAAHINEFGDVYGGEPGDQTGHEISVDPFYPFSPGGWDGVLRYKG